MVYNPPLEVSPEIVAWLRDNARRLAFAGDMLRVIQRKGGLTQTQLDMIAQLRRAT